jgi:hypothetical protein
MLTAIERRYTEFFNSLLRTIAVSQPPQRVL